MKQVKNLLDVPRTVSTTLVVRELGVQPLELGWLRGTLRLYHQLAQAPAHSLHGAVVRAEWEDACIHNIKN